VSEEGSRFVAIQGSVSEYIKRLKDFGISKIDFRRTQNDLYHLWATNHSAEDTYWAILNQLTKKISDEPFLTSKLFFYMGDYLLTTGMSPKAAIFEGHRWALRGLLEDGIWKVINKTADDKKVCPDCQSFDHEVFETIDALKDLPVQSRCTSEHCRCSYHNPQSIAKSINGEGV
jgi:hypothetical protein